MKAYSKQELDKIIDNHKLWLQSGGSKGERANLSSADLRYANLSSADLRYADLSSANLDYSAFPLWCGGLDVHIDDKQATQLLYHLLRNVKYSKNTSAKLKKLCKIKSLVKQANEFHRVNECGKIESTLKGANDEVANDFMTELDSLEYDKKLIFDEGKSWHRTAELNAQRIIELEGKLEKSRCEVEALKIANEKMYSAIEATKTEVIEEYRQRVNTKMGKHTHLLAKEYVQRILREVAKEMKGGE